MNSSSVDPLYIQLADRLTDAISAGVLGPGQQLPPETALMKEYAISRVTVRQAIQLLARNGRVVSKRGKGSFVVRATFEQDLSSLQGFQEALRRQGVEPETELLEFSATTGRIDGQLPAGLDLPVRLRRRYCVDGEAFAIVEAFLPAAAQAVGDVRARQLSVYDIVGQFLGLRIGRADIAIQCARPKNKISTELGLAPRSHVLLMQRTSYTVAGDPCEHMRIYIVPERYIFRMSVPGPIQLARAIQPVHAESTGAPVQVASRG